MRSARGTCPQGRGHGTRLPLSLVVPDAGILSIRGPIQSVQWSDRTERVSRQPDVAGRDGTSVAESDLVTGATGLLGSHIAEQLASRGRRVRALVRPSSDTAFL